MTSSLTLPDPRTLTEKGRAQAAWRAHEFEDFEFDFTQLEWLNTKPCMLHEPVSDPLCRFCGLYPRQHQRTGAAWQFMGMHTFLADTVGSGKTATLCATLAMCKATGELGTGNRAVVVCQAPAVRDPWAKDLSRLLPGIPFIIADGTPAQRQKLYMSNWEICVISDRTFAPAKGDNSRDGDVEILREFPVGILVYDDVDPMRNRATATAYAVRRLAAQCARVHGLHGTPLQKRLHELYSFLEPVGSARVFGSPARFKQRYVTQEKLTVWVPAMVCPGGFPCSSHLNMEPGCKNCGRPHKWVPPHKVCPECGQYGNRDKTGRARVQKTIWKDNGVDQDNLPDFQAKIAPLVLRRTRFGDVTLPEVQPCPVYVDLLKPQRDRYQELRKGILKRLKNGAVEVSESEAAAAFTHGAQICSGLAALDGPGNDVSVKLDWAVDKITGDLEDEKIVCYVHFKANVAALSARLDAAGVGHVLFWSEETNSKVRDARRQRFLEDPDCRVLIGTTTIEKSLNLQVAGHMIAVDTIMNASRMTQLVGRISRQGSKYSTVFLHHLLARETQEKAYLELLAREGAMADAVWGEKEAIFTVLTPKQVLELVAGVAA